MTGKQSLSPIEKLRLIGDARESLDVWPDYLKLGLGREHIPALIELAVDRRFLESDEETPEIWATVHAWRALAQLRAVEAVEPLCGLLSLADSAVNGDWILEELPVVFGSIGPAALQALQ
ncbi:MAG: hypothetical protein ACM3ZC_08450 [Bacteroidota bacterium]